MFYITIKIWCFLCLTSLILLITNSLQAQCIESEILNLRRTAIVFGEKNYKNVGALNNPLNDASDISDSLKKVGFEVVTYPDADKKTMDAAIDDWCNKASKYDVLLFYYSGHGAEYNGENFIFPVDANPKGPTDLNNSAVSATKLLDRMVSINPKFTIMILDACRNNPFTKSWVRGFAKDGLSEMNGKGAFIGYAATPGFTASDGTGRNGSYTEGILKYITVPNLPIDQIFTKVNSYVRLKTGGEQIPYKNSSLSTEYCFSVIRTKKNSANPKKELFFQPSSALTSVRGGETLYAVDNIAGNVVSKDVNTLTNVFGVPMSIGKPTQVTSRNGDNLYIIDSANKKLSIVDWKKNILLNQLSLKYSPSSIAVTNNESKAFVSNSEGIDIINLVDKKLVTTIPLSSKPGGIVISSDNKYLYTSSHAIGENNSLKIIDTRNYKIVKSIPNISNGSTVGITPDNKKLYLNSYLGNRSQVEIFDLITLKTQSTIPVKANTFAFSYDNKYAFVVGDTDIFIIDNNNNDIITKMPFATRPKGMSIGSNGSIFVWLPNESLMFTTRLDKNLLTKDFNDPEIALNKFISESKKDVTHDDFAKINNAVGKSYKLYTDVIEDIVKQIGVNFRFKSLIPLTNMFKPEKFTYKYIDGIEKVNDPTKQILPSLIIKIKGNDILFSLFNGETDKDEALWNSNLSNIDWAKARTFFKKYFTDRLNQLN